VERREKRWREATTMTSVTPIIDEELCTGCGDCVATCPTAALEVVEGKATMVRPDDCNYCTECESFCPEGAIACGFEIVFAENV
jgi:NAD-dependent dihydropyrimidine dehydrogenase PreA subunit